MADYYSKTRTNYFSVTDEEKFRQIINKCSASDDIVVFDDVQSDGSVKFGFLCHGNIQGLPEITDEDGSVSTEIPDDEEYDDDDFEYSHDAFCEALQRILPEGEAIIITEVGYEAMRYLAGSCSVITNSDYRYVDLSDEAIKLTRNMLNNQGFTTKMYY